MSDLDIDLSWHRTEPELTVGGYSTAHQIRYHERVELVADAAPDYGGSAGNVNPEQALAAAISSCHMLTFLALAAKTRWPVVSYCDHAVAHLSRNPKGKMAVTQIDLNPTVGFDPGFEVDAAELALMHDRAHRYCFIATSLADSIKVNVL